jgi:putative addiction module killer protein
MDYNFPMFQIVKSETFDGWMHSLKDRLVRLRIQARIDRLADGNPGDVKPVREGVSELRIDFGPGYRVYFKQIG